MTGLEPDNVPFHEVRPPNYTIPLCCSKNKIKKYTFNDGKSPLPESLLPCKNNRVPVHMP